MDGTDTPDLLIADFYLKKVNKKNWFGISIALMIVKNNNEIRILVFQGMDYA